MGSNGSKNKDQKAAKMVEMLVKTDKTTYFAGDTVTGRVYIYILQAYYCKKLILRLKGKESIHFLDQGDDKRHREHGLLAKGTKRDLREESNLIINKAETLYEWDTEVKPDAYEIPFSFMVPKDLPSSFSQEANGLVANIRYRIEAILEPCNPKKDPKIKSKQNIIVRQGVQNAQQNVQSSVNTNLTTLCCLSAGNQAIRVHFDKNYYCPGERAKLKIDLDNLRSSLKTKNITITLNQSLFLSTKKKTTNWRYNKLTTTINGPAAKKSNSYLVELVLPAFQNANNEFKKMVPKERVKQLISLLNNPNILNSSVRSRLITSEFFITITCEMDGSCTQIPTLSCPIEIYHPEEIEARDVVAPPDWNPHVMEPVNIAFGSAGMPIPSPQMLYSPTTDTLALTGIGLGEDQALAPISEMIPQNINTSQHFMQMPSQQQFAPNPMAMSGMLMPSPSQGMMIQPHMMPGTGMSQGMMTQPQMMGMPGYMGPNQVISQQQMPMMMMMPQQQQQPMMIMPQQPMMMMPQQQPMMMMPQPPMMMGQQPMMMPPQQMSMAGGPQVAIFHGQANGQQVAISVS